MQENSWWTWVDGSGRSYAPSAIPALWLRVADRRSLPEARQEFGRMIDLSVYRPSRLLSGEEAYSVGEREDEAEWRAQHYRLREMAKLWQPSPHDPAVHELVPFNILQHTDAMLLRSELEQAAMRQDPDLVLRLDGWHLRVIPHTLKGFLLMTCAADVAARQRFRRCDRCNQWFPIQRIDNRFCSGACRQAYHQATKEEAA